MSVVFMEVAAKDGEEKDWVIRRGEGRYILAFPDLCCEGVLGGFFESHG